MDGRVQLPVIKYLQERFKVRYVDSITEAGPIRILSEEYRQSSALAILHKLNLSIKNHKPSGVAVVGHHDCLGNPVPRNEQLKQIQKTIQFLRHQFADLEIIGLWVDENWKVMEVGTWQELG